ncbi:MAG: hypothetical protein C0631_03970 [Sedimenticola sp.]|nr:MAG: hypothetical protein C0631_03970 [Sedimenticola sp.]
MGKKMVDKRHMGKIGFACSAVLSSFGAMAIGEGEATGFPVGSGYLYPSVGVEVGYDDNIFLQENDEKSSWVTVISPKAKMEFEGEATTVALNLGAEVGNFANSHRDDYFDGNVSIDVSFYPTERATFAVSAGYKKSHEARGTAAQAGDAAFLFDRPNRYQIVEAGARFAYGLDQVGAPRFELALITDDRTYDNNRTATIYRDRDSQEAKASLFYKVMPATSLLLEGRATKYDYDVATLDSKQYRLMAGVLWEATSQTEGFAKFGYGKKNFEDASREDANSASWELGVNWKPLSYSMFTLATSKDFDETDSVGDYVDSREISLEWKHDWYTYLGSKLQFSYGTDDYGNDLREDDVWQAGVKVDYRLRPGLIVGAGFTHTDLDSNEPGLSYKDNVVGVQLGVNM